MELVISLLVGILSLSLTLYYSFRRAKTDGEERNMKKMIKTLPPEPPGGWPIIGHLPKLITGNSPICRTLAAMADQCGPVYMIQMGMQPALVVNNWDAAKECLTVNDKVLASRPASAMGKYIAHNLAMFGLAPYGPYWSEMKKFTKVELLSNLRLDELQKLRLAEIDKFIKDLYWFTNNKDNDRNIALCEWLRALMTNIITRMVANKSFGYGTIRDEEAQKVVRVIKELMHVAGLFVLSDAFPFPIMEWLDPQGHIRTMKRISNDLDAIIMRWIDEHQKGSLVGHEHKDFIDVVLSAIREGKVKSDQHTNETIIKATIENMILAATDSMAVAMIWLVSLLLNNRHVSKRAQEDIDRVVGRERWVEESDLKSLSYIEAVTKEALRLYAPAPLLVPHEAIADCTVAGYHVQKGTRLFINIWKIHRDPRIWKNPEEFCPERFLMSEEAANFEVTGQHFWFIPFGSGRRSCPGIELALRVLQLVVARLLQGFNMETPLNKPVDMSEGLGITMPKVVPLVVSLTPRLPCKLYQH